MHGVPFIGCIQFVESTWETENTKHDLQRVAEFPNTKKKLYRGRIMLVGAFGAGKTSTKRSLLKEVFEGEHFSTDGADVYEIDITDWVIKESKTDQCRGERSIDETRNLMEDTLLFGMKKQEWQKTPAKPTTSSKHIDIIDDLKTDDDDDDDDHSLYDNTEYRFSERIQRRLREVKDVDKPDLYFSLWDSAGQMLYYTTHQVFLTSRVIYILVTDLTKSLDDILSSKAEGPWRDEWMVKDFLSFWMNSIHAHATPGDSPSRGAQAASHTVTAPPVIIVGTKKDLLPESRNRERLAEERLNDIYDYIRKHCVAASVHLRRDDMIAVDNKSREGDTPSDPQIEKLRQRIKSMAEEYFFLGEVPVKWIHLELTFRKMKKQVLKLREVYTIGDRINLKREDVDKALEFFHSVGEIVHYVSEPELKDTVILDVGWLVNLFKLVITQKLPWSSLSTRLHKRVEELSDEGRLCESLLDHILNEKDRIHDKEILLKIMEKFDILCYIPCSTRARPQSNVYYLPSLLTRGKDEKDDIICPTDSIACCPIYFHFPGNFLPEGLYYKLIVRCSRKWQQNPVLVKHRSRVPINNERIVQVTLCKNGSDIEMRVMSLGGRHITELNPEMVTDVRETVEAELSALIKTYCPGLSYRASLKCPCEHHEPGKLIPGVDDIDDTCAAIDTSDDGPLRKGRVICSRSNIPFKEEDLRIWYSTTVHTTTHEDRREREFPQIDPLAILYMDIEDSLLEKDVKKIRLILKDKAIPRGALEKLDGPAQILKSLQDRAMISANNLDFLQMILKTIGRNDLLDLINVYKKSH
ncbi:putative serine/threonine-protein kinase pats1 isoform X2 [Glandiceps talaboti]